MVDCEREWDGLGERVQKKGSWWPLPRAGWDRLSGRRRVEGGKRVWERREHAPGLLWG